MQQDETRTFVCQACGEPNEVIVDPSAGVRQVFVEDCTICCRPNVLTVTIDTRRDVVTVEAELEG